jgi:hypothetical protein
MMDVVSPKDIAGEFLKGSVPDILQLSLEVYKNLPGFKTIIPCAGDRAGRKMKIKPRQTPAVYVLILFIKGEFKPCKL